MPLIRFSTEIQEGFLVEKYYLSEEGVKDLCNLETNNVLVETPMYQNLASSGVAIDFKELNNFKAKIIGLFGPIKAVIRSMEYLLNAESMGSINQELVRYGTGLYLIHCSCDERQFLVFISEEDSDLDFVRKNSRAVHFLRYMSQLTNNIVMCMDENYQDRLAVTTARTGSQKAKRFESVYVRKERSSAVKTSVSVKELGYIQIATAQHAYAGSARLFSSQNGLLLAELNKVSSRNVEKSYKIGTVHELRSDVESVRIDDVSLVCDVFKEEYVKQLYHEQFRAIQLKVSQCVEKDKDKKKRDVQNSFLNSLALFFIEKHRPEDFQILEKYFVSNLDSTQNLWQKRTVLTRDKVVKFLAEGDIAKIQKKMDVECEEILAIDKYLMWQAMCKSGNGLPLHLKCSSIQKETWKKVSKAAEEIFEPYKEKSIITVGSRVMLEKSLASKTINFGERCDELKACVDSFFNHVLKIIKPFAGKRSCVQYYEECFLKKLAAMKDRMVAKEVSELFQRMFENNSMPSSSKSEISIANIEDSTYEEVSIGPEFRCTFEKTTEKGPKMRASVLQLMASRDEHQRLSYYSAGTVALNLNKISVAPIGCEIFLTDSGSLKALYQVDSSKILALVNKPTSSAIAVYKLSHARPVFQAAFREPILDCSFDSITRVLAIREQTNVEPWKIHLFVFSEDYLTKQDLNPVDLNRLFHVNSDFAFSLQFKGSSVWFFNNGVVRNFDYQKQKLITSVKVKAKRVKLLCVPGGSCLFAFCDEKYALPIVTETGHLGSRIETDGTNYHLFSICNQTLLVRQTYDGRLFCQQVSVSQSYPGGVFNQDNNQSQLSAQSHNELDRSQEYHWLNYIYWLYFKFPCKDILLTDQAITHFWFSVPQLGKEVCKKVNNEICLIWNKLIETRKPLEQHLQLHSGKIKSTGDNFFGDFFSEVPRGDFIKKLITFVPTQIARCQSNSFLILDKGQPISLESVNMAFDLVEKIDFGLFESIFNAWNGDVKVISSMGKQSTGKSYTLNHLTGSSFNIAGTRCTDGCWMSVKECEDCLYVILDFEGLGSIERTEQDDMLLSLFSSAISTFTLFKTDKQIDRGLERMFNKFNLSSDQLERTDKIFQGSFMVVINDVIGDDVEETRREFREKIKMISEQSENNFFCNLYNSNPRISAFPPFQTSDYYQELENLMVKIKTEIKPVFSGSDFLMTIKLLMAKLAISDFSSLDKHQLLDRIRKLRSLMDFAFVYGRTSSEEGHEFELKRFQNPQNEVNTQKDIMIEPIGQITLDDQKLVLKEGHLEVVVACFQSEAASLLTETSLDVWRGALVKYAVESIVFRFERVSLWATQNLKEWENSLGGKHTNLVTDFLENIECKKVQFLHKFQFCDERCSECYLKCTQISGHVGDHRCPTDHKCPANCCYCTEGFDKCSMKFGHAGSHQCDKDHVCGQSCRFSSLNGCAEKCTKKAQHSGQHECSEIVHPCLQKCSHEKCQGTCIIECEVKHQVHKCIKEECIETCSMSNCTNKCSARDHFHRTKDSERYRSEQKLSKELPFILPDGTRKDFDRHFCENEHPCEHECSLDGYCQVWTEKEKVKKRPLKANWTHLITR